jgi:hypothetical protein
MSADQGREPIEVGAAERAGGRARRRLSRTLSRARWSEYRELLERAQAGGYVIMSLESWLAADPGAGQSPVLVLRHDVDQHPASALAMAEIESALGVRSTWYFRWRTAHARVISALRAEGSEVGLHYETLTRMVLGQGGGGEAAVTPELIARARAELRLEVGAFERLHGPIRSVAPHGDTRVPGVRNALLLKGEPAEAYGVEFDGNEAMRGRGLRAWLTDRSAAEGRWADGADPNRLLGDRVSPILCLTHPNNWVSGASLWLDRGLSRLLPDRKPRAGLRPVRTGSDRPPL